MRPICDAHFDHGERPVVILTRELVRPHMDRVTIAPVVSVRRGLSTEVPVGVDNGVDAGSAVDCDAVTTIPVTALGVNRGFLLPAQELSLSLALRCAFDLES
ncbi:type II toxin-antitoxin system PemK/MazF family toxin [Rhodococcus sp. (in: high G+C Gram-positive bacteria)]|uniref:type II toxin-antitoxin system PemK/MazF family toxin n=1 Tax=Rhodococcus sp. TaxID=1831 RepID=UPI00257EB5BF|nr:type II toxin-antitoxin system PemK/MazF family toxin [Rhodococcus sp. (in: high G+C Gram-positive bacteria)]MBQ7804432.1 type II toxin-antitoxin system PemK/MazF family toxin [Rhodococcus sp. (in: high G+C Gram-positive bacteria)]